MRSVQGANRLAVIVLLFSLAFAGYGLTQTSPSKESESHDAVTASKQLVLPDFVTLAEKLGPVVVNISTTQIDKGNSDFDSENPLIELWRRFFGESYSSGSSTAGPRLGIDHRARWHYSHQ